MKRSTCWGLWHGSCQRRCGSVAKFAEVISTLLFNFIAVWLVYWCVQSEHLLRQPMTTGTTLPESLPIPDGAQLPFLTGDPASPVTIGLAISAFLALAVAVVLGQ